MSNLYRCFSTGLNRRKLIKFDGDYISNTYEAIQKNPDKDFYESIYLYNDEHVKRFKETNSLAGIKDGVKTDRIVFDFDSKQVQNALDDSRTLVARIAEKVPQEAIRVFHSANKGFHVEVHIDSYVTRSEFEAVVESFAGDLNTFDHKIKDEQRLFRFPLTKHNVSGRFKIPLTVEQLNTLSLEQIEKMSTLTDHSMFYEVLNSYSTIPLFVNPATLVKKDKKVEKIVTQVSSDRPDMSRKPKHLTAAKFALQEGFFGDGERNEACMILATTYKYLGYNQETTYNIIKATLRLRARRLGVESSETDKQELWRTIITPVYSPLWKGGTYSEEEGLLAKTIELYELNRAVLSETTLVDLSSLSSHYMDFAVNIDANTIKLGIDEIDRKLRITTSSLVSFLAAPSAGKSSVSFGILNTVSKSGEKAIFFSMDMSIPQVYQRLIQRHTGHNEDQITDNYKNKVTHEIEKYQSVLGAEYPNIKFCFKSGMSPDDVKDVILHCQQTTGQLPRLVILDYLECMSFPGVSDSTQSKALISTALKGVANELGVCIILLVQPRMMAGGPAGELNSYTDIKGSSVISEASAQVITMSRPGFSPKNPEDDNYVTINIVKNRMGKLSSTDLHWEGLTGHIRSLSSEEENDLKALRAAIAADKQSNKKDDLY